MFKVEKEKYHIRLYLGDAAFAIPIEVIKGIKSGELPDDKYEQAREFLNGENKKFGVSISKETLKGLFENAITA